MAETPPFWLDDDGSFWISAELYPDAREAGVALMDAASFSMDDGVSLECHGRGMVSLRDCPLDDCEGHHDEATGRELDCPSISRDVWAFESFGEGMESWPDIEDAIARGRVVLLHEDLAERGGQVHWRDDCWCPRCDALDVLGRDEPFPVFEAPSIPMFEEA